MTTLQAYFESPPEADGRRWAFIKAGYHVPGNAEQWERQMRRYGFSSSWGAIREAGRALERVLGNEMIEVPYRSGAVWQVSVPFAGSEAELHKTLRRCAEELLRRASDAARVMCVGIVGTFDAETQWSIRWTLGYRESKLAEAHPNENSVLVVPADELLAPGRPFFRSLAPSQRALERLLADGPATVSLAVVADRRAGGRFFEGMDDETVKVRERLDNELERIVVPHGAVISTVGVNSGCAVVLPGDTSAARPLLERVRERLPKGDFTFWIDDHPYGMQHLKSAVEPRAAIVSARAGDRVETLLARAVEALAERDEPLVVVER